MDNTEMFHNKKMVFAETLISDSKQSPSNQYRRSYALVVIDNTETFHNQKKGVAEIVGFRFEENLFKSVPIVIGVGCNGQH